METYQCEVCGNTNYSDTPCIRCNWKYYSEWKDKYNDGKNSDPSLKGYGWICQVCDNYNIGDYNEFDVCPLCGWEDDNIQRDDHDYDGGANWMSLNHAKANWKAYGTIETEEEKIERKEFYKKHIAPDGTWID
jgi:hypothetical protein